MKVEILLYLAITNNHYFDILDSYNPNPYRVKRWSVRVQIFRLWFVRFRVHAKSILSAFILRAQIVICRCLFIPTGFELDCLELQVKADLHLQRLKL